MLQLILILTFKNFIKFAYEGKIIRFGYEDKIQIPPIERYFQFLTLEQRSRGREETLKLPEFVGRSIETVASALKGIDEKLNKVATLPEKIGISQ